MTARDLPRLTLALLLLGAATGPTRGESFDGCAFSSKGLELGTLLRWIEARGDLALDVDLDVRLDCPVSELETGPDCLQALGLLAAATGLVVEGESDHEWRLRLRRDAAGGQCAVRASDLPPLTQEVRFEPPTRTLGEALDRLRESGLIVRSVLGPPLSNRVEIEGTLRADEALATVAELGKAVLVRHAHGGLFHGRDLESRQLFANYPPRFPATGLTEEVVSLPLNEGLRLDALVERLSEILDRPIELGPGRWDLRDERSRATEIRLKPIGAPPEIELQRFALAMGYEWDRDGDRVLVRGEDFWIGRPRPLVILRAQLENEGMEATISALLAGHPGPWFVAGLGRTSKVRPLRPELSMLNPALYVSIGGPARRCLEKGEPAHVALTIRRKNTPAHGAVPSDCGVILDPSSRLLADEFLDALPFVSRVGLVGRMRDPGPGGPLDQLLRWKGVQATRIRARTGLDLQDELDEMEARDQLPDALWLQLDSELHSAGDAALRGLIQAATERGLTVVGSNSRMLDLGATLALSVPPEHLGELGSRILSRLEKGELPTQIGFVELERLSLERAPAASASP